MSAQYDLYLFDHRNGVRKAFDWIKESIPQVLADLDKSLDWDIGFAHDESKGSREEYQAYDDYFYGDKSYAVVRNFDYAWLHHIHNNPHHWQYWVLINDDEKDGTKALEWYEEHKDRMILHVKTREKVEWILSEIKKKLDEMDGFVTIVIDSDTDGRTMVAVKPEDIKHLEAGGEDGV